MSYTISLCILYIVTGGLRTKSLCLCVYAHDASTCSTCGIMYNYSIDYLWLQYVIIGRACTHVLTVLPIVHGEQMENFSWAPGFIEIWKWDVIMDHNNYTDETTLRKNAVLYSAQTDTYNMHTLYRVGIQPLDVVHVCLVHIIMWLHCSICVYWPN